MAKTRSPEPDKAKKGGKLKILVSSAVYGYEDMLESIYALLDTFGYDVLMSHKGTVPVDPNESALNSCLDAVAKCDLFFGLIMPWYGTGKETASGLSITHREMVESVALNKPRWFLVHEHAAVARQLLDPYRVQDRQGKPTCPFELQPGMAFQKTPILSDLRVIDML